MKYALGNMLNGAGGLNPDGLSLDLQFAADKTLTARKGPTPAFTRASSGRFVGSNGLIQSAANNEPRFDHDPVTLACKGLLIEESRTNTLIQSNDFANAAWAKSNIGIGSTTNLSPDGSNNATLLIAGTASVSWIFRSGITASGSTVTFFAKSSGKRWSVVDASSGAGTAGVWFDLQNGVVGTVQSGYTASIQQFPNGFYRCRVTYPSSGAGTFCVIGVSDNDGLFISTGNGSNGIILYGAQLEAGAFPTSYIPTTTASVVRSVDLCSISGSNFTGFWNQSAGTLVEAFEASPNTNTTYVSASNGNIVQNSVHLDNDTGLMRAVYYSGSSLVATLDLGSVGTVGTVNTIATAYSVNDFAASRNGGTVVTDTSGAVPASLSQMNIGADERSQTPTSFYSNRCIKSLRYYKKRLGNAKLQTLST